MPDSGVTLSVITAVYNGDDVIEEALRSSLSQTYEHVERIIIDGASIDGTKQILDRYAHRIDRIVSEPDQGIYDALNKGIGCATGDVIGFLHADDVYADSGVLARVAAAFADPEVDAVYGDLVYVRRNNPSQTLRYWKAGEYSPEKLKHGWMPPHPAFFVRRRFYEELGGFDLSYRIAADYDCMLRFLSRGALRCMYIPEVLVKMRAGGASNRSLGNILRKSSEDYRALKANGVGGIFALLRKNLGKLGQFVRREV